MFKTSLCLCLVLIPSLLFSIPVVASNVFYADKQFKSGNYAEAKKAYLALVKYGNPHAYYQLANIYYNGLGTDKDVLNAMLYFYLAAEQNFHNSQSIIDNILSSLPDENKAAVMQVLENHRNENSIEKINTSLFPIINTKMLDQFVTFEGEAALETVYHPEDIDLDDYDNDFGSYNFDESEDEFDADNSLVLLVSTPKVPFLIIDHEVHNDGSVRYTRDVQKFGLYKPLLDEFVLFPLKRPDYNNKPRNFVSRSYLGAAAYDRFTLIRTHQAMHDRVVQKVRRYKKSEDINDRFNLAMLMLNFPWISQEENEAENMLLALSKLGHSPAMYEYGLKLYREQTDIEQAIYWLSEASRYGLARAEYRLAKIILDSDWVEFDEKKALYWFESAAMKGDLAASIRAADLLLTAKDKSLHDIDKAANILTEIASSQSKNPEYFYLLALSSKKGSKRDIKATIDNLYKAISFGQIANWDVSEWEDVLRDILAGDIRIIED